MITEQKDRGFRKKALDFLLFFKDRFDLHEGKEDEIETIEYVRKNIEFKGANLWILIFAILVASVGLNVNSTAVIIGAMLISPLMGPIMGIGMSAGINDFELLKKSLKNLGIAVFISIITSTIYFSFTPLDDARSELLARTEPSIWDVFIALFGGLAGIVAGSRKEKSNAIPGVAIATALMPPLCTAGYGLATGNIYYFFGAFYLFFINSVFISLSTYLIVRFMNFPKKEFVDPKREKRVKSYITLFTILTIVPSVYLAYNIVKRTLWEEIANQYIAAEMQFPNAQVIHSKLTYEVDSSTIEVTLIGEKLDQEKISMLNSRIKNYGLTNTHLSVKQSGDQGTDLNVLRSDVLKDLYERNENIIKDKDLRIALLEKEIADYGRTNRQVLDIGQEALVNHKNLEKFSINSSIIANLDKGQQDTLVLAYAQFSRKPSQEETNRLKEWLKLRTKSDSIALIIQ
ncbi:TIGR00341 family protein [Echinicola jeungdonensis]|uniref:TIGR00341 family protein n=1 Tax=Echinicola jeungdonensis TaxID=709343 RepID=A0ABV5J641_9BACT|nr:TIGR00341 family protein [Echinicola jeungdonensis]MDN3668041.1 TIGR00341 family protein [Echinicola jeungdonensis]